MFPESRHLRDVGLKGADDQIIWNHARDQGFLIVTKDDDFRELSILRGTPPKLIMLTLGNCKTTEVETTLRAFFGQIEKFNEDSTASLIEIP